MALQLSIQSPVEDTSIQSYWRIREMHFSFDASGSVHGSATIVAYYHASARNSGKQPVIPPMHLQFCDVSKVDANGFQTSMDAGDLTAYSRAAIYTYLKTIKIKGPEGLVLDFTQATDV